jgi:hypothetical protein
VQRRRASFFSSFLDCNVADLIIIFVIFVAIAKTRLLGAHMAYTLAASGA